MHGLETRSVLLMVFALALFAWLLHGEQTPTPLVAQARELIQQGKFAEAEAKLLEAEKVEPNSLPIQRLLGMVYEREAKYLRAEAALQKVVHLSGEKDAETLFLLCKVEFALQKTGDALALARQICQLAKNDPRPLYAV